MNNPRNISVEQVPNLPMEEQPTELVERSIRLLGEQVLPHFR